MDGRELTLIKERVYIHKAHGRKYISISYEWHQTKEKKRMFSRESLSIHLCAFVRKNKKRKKKHV